MYGCRFLKNHYSNNSLKFIFRDTGHKNILFAKSIAIRLNHTNPYLKSNPIDCDLIEFAALFQAKNACMSGTNAPSKN